MHVTDDETTPLGLYPSPPDKTQTAVTSTAMPRTTNTGKQTLYMSVMHKILLEFSKSVF